MLTIKKSIHIMRPVSYVYDTARDPEKWGYWYSSLSRPTSIVGKGEAGTKTEFTYSMMGMHFPVIIEVILDQPSQEEGHWEGTIRGPITGKQHNTYLPKDDGTDVTYELEFSVPTSLLGKVANVLFIHRVEENALVQTLANLKILCELDD